MFLRVGEFQSSGFLGVHSSMPHAGVASSESQSVGNTGRQAVSFGPT
jgi:hypothetical protein